MSAVDACEREKLAAYVVENLDCVAVEGIDLIAELEQGHDWIWINLRTAVFEWVDLGRVAKFCHNQACSVGNHEVAIHPHNVQHHAEVWICHLRECAVPVVQAATGCNGQAIEAVVHRHQGVDWPTNVAQHGHSAVAGHGHKLCSHDSVADAAPVDSATICAWACTVGHNAVAWA